MGARFGVVAGFVLRELGCFEIRLDYVFGRGYFGDVRLF